MKIALVTDAWSPQVNGVVTTLVELVERLRHDGHVIEVLHPGQFRHWPCPGYRGVDLAVLPAHQLRRRLDRFQPDAIHIVTEGPLGWAARAYCLARELAFTTAFHTKFPEIVHAAVGLPVDWGYALLKRFHAPSSCVMVPTRSVLEMLQARGFRRLRAWTHGVDTELFPFHAQAQPLDLGAEVKRPVALFAGRVSYEKNIDAFLRMPFDGTKVVCGTGPVETKLRREHPEVHWLGLQPHKQLARIYGAADVLVFTSRADTFGLVMVEAMACGTPVAALPADGPLEVLGEGGGGAMHEDLAVAVSAALQVPRAAARRRALDFSWATAARLFQDFLVPARALAGPAQSCAGENAPLQPGVAMRS